MQKYDVVIEKDGYIVGSGQFNVLEYGEHGREGTFPRATVFQVDDVTYYVLDLELNKETIDDLIDDLESENAELQERLYSREDTIEDLEYDLDKCETKLEELKDELSERDDHIHELTLVIKDLYKKNLELDSALEQVESAIQLDFTEKDWAELVKKALDGR